MKESFLSGHKIGVIRGAKTGAIKGAKAPLNDPYAVRFIEPLQGVLLGLV